MIRRLPKVISEEAAFTPLIADPLVAAETSRLYLLTPMDRATLLYGKSTVSYIHTEYNYQEISVGR